MTKQCKAVLQIEREPWQCVWITLPTPEPATGLEKGSLIEQEHRQKKEGKHKKQNKLTKF